MTTAHDQTGHHPDAMQKRPFTQPKGGVGVPFLSEDMAARLLAQTTPAQLDEGSAAT